MKNKARLDVSLEELAKQIYDIEEKFLNIGNAINKFVSLGEPIEYISEGYREALKCFPAPAYEIPVGAHTYTYLIDSGILEFYFLIENIERSGKKYEKVRGIIESLGKHGFQYCDTLLKLHEFYFEFLEYLTNEKYINKLHHKIMRKVERKPIHVNFEGEKYIIGKLEENISKLDLKLMEEIYMFCMDKFDKLEKELSNLEAARILLGITYKTLANDTIEEIKKELEILEKEKEKLENEEKELDNVIKKWKNWIIDANTKKLKKEIENIREDLKLPWWYRSLKNVVRYIPLDITKLKENFEDYVEYKDRPFYDDLKKLRKNALEVGNENLRKLLKLAELENKLKKEQKNILEYFKTKEFFEREEIHPKIRALERIKNAKNKIHEEYRTIKRYNKQKWYKNLEKLEKVKLLQLLETP
jgi:hypothetical protein